MRFKVLLVGLFLSLYAYAQTTGPGTTGGGTALSTNIVAPTNNQGLCYQTSSGLWINGTCASGTATSVPASGVTAGALGTGVTLTNLSQLPAQLPGTLVGVPQNAGSAQAPSAITLGSILAIFDATSYGVLCDNLTDDSAALNSWLAAMNTASLSGNFVAVKGILPPQKRCIVHGTLNATGFTQSSGSVIIDGQGATLVATVTGSPIIDAMGSINMMWRDLSVANSSLSTYGIQFGGISNSTNGGAGFSFNNVAITGQYSGAPFYNLGGEEVLWTKAKGVNQYTAGGFGLILDGANHFNITSSFATITTSVDTYRSFNSNEFVESAFEAASSSGAAIWMENTARHRFINSYGYNSASNSSCVYIFATVVGGGVSDYGVNRGADFDLHCESSGLKQIFFITGPGTGGPNFTATPLLRGFSYSDLYTYAATSIFAIDSGANITGITVNGLNISILGGATSPTFTLFDTPGSYTCSGSAYFYYAAADNSGSTCTLYKDDAGTTSLTLSTPIAVGSGGLGVATIPSAGQTPVGNAGGNAYAPKTLSGDCTLVSTGVITCLNTNGTAFGTFATKTYPAGGNGTNLQFLQTNGSGTMSWASTRQALLFNDGGSALGTTDETLYCALTSNSNCHGTVALSYQQAPFGGTLKNLYLTFSAAPGVAGSFTATVYVNGSTTALTCNITNSASTTTCSDTTDSVTVTAGQPIALQLVLGGTISNSATFYGGIEFDNP